MSKIWSAVLAVALVAASLGIIAGVMDYDADGEDAFAKYSVESEDTSNAWFHSGLAEKKTGNKTYTVLKSEDGNFKLKTEEHYNGTVDGVGIDAATLMQGSESDYTKTNVRVGIGATVTHVWQYVDGDDTYKILTGETFDANTIYRMIMERNQNGVVETHVIDFTGNLSTSWTFTYTSSTEADVTVLPYLRDVPDGAATYELNTKFGNMTVTDIGDDIVYAENGLVIVTETGVKGSGTYLNESLSSTNIKL